jgi:hypothetical protein
MKLLQTISEASESKSFADYKLDLYKAATDKYIAWFSKGISALPGISEFKLTADLDQFWSEANGFRYTSVTFRYQEKYFFAGRMSISGNSIQEGRLFLDPNRVMKFFNQENKSQLFLDMISNPDMLKKKIKEEPKSVFMKTASTKFSSLQRNLELAVKQLSK